MKVVFFDVRRETYESVENVHQLSSCQFRIKGRLTNVWFLHLHNGSRSFPQKHYLIHRIEA